MLSSDTFDREENERNSEETNSWHASEENKNYAATDDANS